MNDNVVAYVSTVAMLSVCWLQFFAQAGQGRKADAVFIDEPEAHALSDKMIQTMRNAETLSYKSDYRLEAKDEEGHCTYTIWMKKPNYFRVETENHKGKKCGTLVGDGDYLWIYWPKKRPLFWWEDKQKYQETSTNVYMKKRTPIGRHSIAHKTSLLGGQMDMPIIDPSTFHGYTDSLQSYIDGVRGLGAEKVGDEVCNMVEVSIMKHQRSWYLWLSKKDNLPRKLKEIVRVDYDIITHELWSNVAINAEIPVEKFFWMPPKGWKQWKIPSSEEKLPKPGQVDPDFDLLSSEGRRIKLSDYRGKVVLLVIWRVGCPPCRKEMPYLENIYNRFKDKGLVILGFNCADDEEIAKDFIREHSLTFPNIVDSLDSAEKVAFEDYRTSGVPVNFIIDRAGKIVSAWSGYSEADTKGIETLKKLGVK